MIGGGMYDLTTLHRKNLRAVAKRRPRDASGRWVALGLKDAGKVLKKKRAYDRAYRRGRRDA